MLIRDINTAYFSLADPDDVDQLPAHVLSTQLGLDFSVQVEGVVAKVEHLFMQPSSPRPAKTRVVKRKLSRSQLKKRLQAASPAAKGGNEAEGVPGPSSKGSRLKKRLEAASPAAKGGTEVESESVPGPSSKKRPIDAEAPGIDEPGQSASPAAKGGIDEPGQATSLTAKGGTEMESVFGTSLGERSADAEAPGIDEPGQAASPAAKGGNDTESVPGTSSKKRLADAEAPGIEEPGGKRMKATRPDESPEISSGSKRGVSKVTVGAVESRQSSRLQDKGPRVKYLKNGGMIRPGR